MLIDAHCHLANLAERLEIKPLMVEAGEKGVSGFISSALRRSEIRWHLLNPIPSAIWSAGIHPHFDGCDITLDDLEGLALNRQIHAVGECGLDRGDPDLDTQIDVFERQLALAERYKLTVILHLVGHMDIAIPLLRRHRLTYLVHGYTGSLEGYKQLNGLDSYFTISSRICKLDKRELLNSMICGGRYLFETDITQYYVEESETNPLLRLLEVVDRAVELTSRDRGELIERQWLNYLKLFGGGDA
ncbi:MAG: TatD family hydrolase [Candidatus Cloacimonetes bacterium]|nr:TatD family hydrolase [Candidatus Cloacimonadota bacterium]